MPDSTQFKPRPTTYNGIEMRSRLEAKYASWLTRMGFEWQYEPRCYASDEGQYLPDFQIEGVRFLGREWRTFIEVKPTPERSRGVDKSARILHVSEPDALLVVEVAQLRNPRVILPPSHGAAAFKAFWALDRDSWTHPALVFECKSEWREVA